MENQSHTKEDGGQRGCASSLENQSANLSNLPLCHVEKIEEFGAASNRIQAAAMWLHLHRSEVSGAAIPALKQRFGLRNLEAIEAIKLTHALDYPGA